MPDMQSSTGSTQAVHVPVATMIWHVLFWAARMHCFVVNRYNVLHPAELLSCVSDSMDMQHMRHHEQGGAYACGRAVHHTALPVALVAGDWLARQHALASLGAFSLLPSSLLGTGCGLRWHMAGWRASMRTRAWAALHWPVAAWG